VSAQLASLEAARADDLKALADLREDLATKDILIEDITAAVEDKDQTATLLSQEVAELQQAVARRDKECAEAAEERKKLSAANDSLTARLEDVVAAEKTKIERLEADMEAKFKQRTEALAASAESNRQNMTKENSALAQKAKELDAQLQTVNEDKAALELRLEKRHAEAAATEAAVAQLRQQLSDVTQALEQRQQAGAEARS